MNGGEGSQVGRPHMDATAVIYGVRAQQCILLIQLAVELVVRSIQLQFHARSRAAHNQL